VSVTAVSAENAAGSGTDTEPAIQLDGLTKTYRARDADVAAVAGIDLGIAGGEFFSLLGPSGCGKSTTLRMIAGFEQPTAGRVLLYGTDVTATPPHRRDLNLVFQSYALFPHLSVYDNVAFGLRRRRVAKAEIARRVAEMLDLVELSGHERRQPKELSGGQQQRVALARALVNRPRALLLDEPLGALDLKLRQAMQTELKRIQREVGITFVYVTHDQGEALALSDRLAVMNGGLVEQLGAPRDVYERPATRFVADFIGTSNVLAGTVERVEGGVTVLGAQNGERLVVPSSAGHRAGAQIEFTVRPEKVHISADEPAGDGCRLRGQVTGVVYLGTSTTYTVRSSASTELAVYVQNAAAPTASPAEGDAVWLSWPPDHGWPLTPPAQEGGS
jgi:spermidine/putrescine transport system ATP-binding protein